MDDDPDGRVGEGRGERLELDVLAQGVDERDRLAAVVALRRGELDQAEQRAVAALAHELGVEREPPGRVRSFDQLGCAGRRLRGGRAPRAGPAPSPALAQGLAPGSR